MPNVAAGVCPCSRLLWFAPACYSKHNGVVNHSIVGDLGAYLREQRQAASLSLRQLSDLAGISNPYLSQIERGLKRPSAEILQQIAHGLQLSAESLYVRAGILEESHLEPGHERSVVAAIVADPLLSTRQRNVLLEIYRSFTDPELQARSAARTTGTDDEIAATPTSERPETPPELTSPASRHTTVPTP